MKQPHLFTNVHISLPAIIKRIRYWEDVHGFKLPKVSEVQL